MRNVILRLTAISAIVIVLLFFPATFAWAGTAESNSASNAEPPNIIIILVDDMGYGDAGCYNANSKIPTPHIDSLARDGMRFTDAHAAGPLCHVSRYGLMTGESPFRATPNAWRKKPSIRPDQTTIASLLKQNGYHTAMVGKWHLGFYENGYDQPLRGGPIDVGFDSYFGIRASTDIPDYFYIRGDRAVQAPSETIEANSTAGWSPIQGAFWRKGLIAPDLNLHDVLPTFTQEAIRVIDDHAKADRGEPLFLYLAYPAPHTPWLPAKEFEGASKADMYGDFTNMVDANIGKVLASLERHQMKENTLVIFSSDNGPVWYDKDVKKYDHDSSGGLRGMKADAWECGHRMPFIARWPNQIASGKVSNQMVNFTDLLATFAELLNQELPYEQGPDSFSFLKVLTGDQPEEEPVREFMVINAGKKYSIRKGPWKFIEGQGSGGFSKPVKSEKIAPAIKGQLYDLSKDIGEMNNLYADRPELVKELTTKLKVIRESGRSR